MQPRAALGVCPCMPRHTKIWSKIPICIHICILSSTAYGPNSTKSPATKPKIGIAPPFLSLRRRGPFPVRPLPTSLPLPFASGPPASTTVPQPQRRGSSRSIQGRAIRGGERGAPLQPAPGTSAPAASGRQAGSQRRRQPSDQCSTSALSKQASSLAR